MKRGFDKMRNNSLYRLFFLSFILIIMGNNIYTKSKYYFMLLDNINTDKIKNIELKNRILDAKINKAPFLIWEFNKIIHLIYPFYVSITRESEYFEDFSNLEKENKNWQNNRKYPYFLENENFMILCINQIKEGQADMLISFKKVLSKIRNPIKYFIIESIPRKYIFKVNIFYLDNENKLQREDILCNKDKDERLYYIFEKLPDINFDKLYVQLRDSEYLTIEIVGNIKNNPIRNIYSKLIFRHKNQAEKRLDSFANPTLLSPYILKLDFSKNKNEEFLFFLESQLFLRDDVNRNDIKLLGERDIFEDIISMYRNNSDIVNKTSKIILFCFEPALIKWSLDKQTEISELDDQNREMVGGLRELFRSLIDFNKKVIDFKIEGFADRSGEPITNKEAFWPENIKFGEKRANHIRDFVLSQNEEKELMGFRKHIAM